MGPRAEGRLRGMCPVKRWMLVSEREEWCRWPERDKRAGEPPEMDRITWFPESPLLFDRRFCDSLKSSTFPLSLMLVWGGYVLHVQETVITTPKKDHHLLIGRFCWWQNKSNTAHGFSILSYRDLLKYSSSRHKLCPKVWRNHLQIFTFSCIHFPAETGGVRR